LTNDSNFSHSICTSTISNNIITCTTFNNIADGTIKWDDAAGSSHSQTISSIDNVDASAQADAAVDLTITGSTSNNIIKGGAGDDVITGGAGNDTITLGGGADKVVFSGLTAATNGSDTISTVQTADKYDFIGIFGGNNGALSTKNATDNGAITLAAATALAKENTSIAIADKALYIAEVANKADIDSVGDIKTALTDNGVMDAVDFTSGKDAILIVGGADDDTTHYIYSVHDDGLTDGEVVLLGTVTTDITNGVDGLTTSNLVFS